MQCIHSSGTISQPDTAAVSTGIRITVDPGAVDHDIAAAVGQNRIILP